MWYAFSNLLKYYAFEPIKVLLLTTPASKWSMNASDSFMQQGGGVIAPLFEVKTFFPLFLFARKMKNRTPPPPPANDDLIFFFWLFTSPFYEMLHMVLLWSVMHSIEYVILTCSPTPWQLPEPKLQTWLLHSGILQCAWIKVLLLLLS